MRLIDAEQFKNKINNSELYSSEEWVKVLDMLADCDSIDAVPKEELLNILYGRLDFLQKWRNGTADFKHIAAAMIEDCEDIIDIIKSLKEKTDDRQAN